MTPEQRNSWPLPPMDEMPDEAALTRGPHTAGEAGVVGAPPHSDWLKQANWLIRMTGLDRQQRYVTDRRAHAEAIGRPYPDARHPVWPR